MLEGRLTATRMRDDTAITLTNDIFTKRVEFDGASIKGGLDVHGSRFKQGIDANRANVANGTNITGSTINGSSKEAIDLFECRDAAAP